MVLRISPTMDAMFTGCPAQYYQRYVLGRKVPPGIALHMGTGLHKASEVNFVQKKTTREDLPKSVLEDAAEQGFKDRLEEEGVLLSQEEKGRASLLLEESRVKTIEMAGVLHEEVAPLIQPIEVEAEVEFTRENTPGIVYRGRLDIADESQKLIDIKTSKARWGKDKGDGQNQPVFYMTGARESLNIDSDEFLFHIVTKAKTPTHQLVSTTCDESDLIALEQRALVLQAMRAAGLFPPCDPESWRCSPKWCGYFLAGCKYISKRRIFSYINREEVSE